MPTLPPDIDLLYDARYDQWAGTGALASRIARSGDTDAVAAFRVKVHDHLTGRHLAGEPLAYVLNNYDREALAREVLAEHF